MSGPFSTDVPIRVAAIDVDEAFPAITAERSEGGRYVGAWLLLRIAGRPCRLVKLPFVDGRVTRAQLERDIDDMLATSTSATAPKCPSPAPRISVVVCTVRSRERELEACLSSLERLTYPNYEIVLVDNRPAASATVDDPLEHRPRVRLLREPRPGASPARNCGLAGADGEIVVFTDDDVVVDPGWLTAFAERFAQHPDEVCATGLVLPNNLETPAQAELERFYGGFGQRRLDPVSHALASRRHPLAPPRVVGVGDDGMPATEFLLYDFGKFGAGASMAFRADALRSVGGFDVRLGPASPTHSGEELCVFAKLVWRGQRVAFVPAALAFHTHRRDYESLRRQIYRYGVGYTAAVIALALSEPGLLRGLLATLPAGGTALLRAYANKLRGAATAADGRSDLDASAGLARREMLGMAYGPLALLHSTLAARRWR